MTLHRLFQIAFTGIIFAAIAGISSVAQNPVTPPSEPTPAVPAPDLPRAQRVQNNKWRIRVEVLMVSMPQETALALLPDLRSSEKIDAAVQRIFDAIKRNEAVLTGYPSGETTDGERCMTEAVIEYPYATAYATAAAPAHADGKKDDESGATLATGVYPTEFETRNLGPSLEFDPVVLDDGASARIRLHAKRVDLVRVSEHPEFFSTTVSTETILQSGQRSLLGVHKIAKPENHLELFIVQTVITRRN